MFLQQYKITDCTTFVIPSGTGISMQNFLGCHKVQVQALANVSRSGYAATETKPVHRLHIRPSANSAQLGGTPQPFPILHPGPCSSVGMRPRTDRQTDT